jgi:hypothetical protein
MRRKRWLALALAAAGLFTISTTAVAQQRDRGPAERLLANRQELELTEDQTKRLESIQERQAALRAELRKSYDETLAVLTPEQRDKARALRREQGHGRRHGRAHRHQDADSVAN